MENWEQIDAVQRVQDYIEKHIGEPISLYRLAQAAAYSPWHTSRIFKEYTGKTPLEYIRQLRLSRAALQLWDDNKRIIDVALDFAFSSHEGFTRAFSDMFGMTPHDYRRNTPIIPLFMPSPVRARYLLAKKGAIKVQEKTSRNTVFVQVVDRPARRLILKRGVKAANYYDYCGEVGCEVWAELCSIKQALYEPIGMWLPENLRRPGTSEYAQGVEVPAGFDADLPDGYEIIDLPPCMVMVFQGPPFKEEDFEEAITDMWGLMKTYDPVFYGFKWADEDGPRFQLVPLGERGYIEARPVRRI